jgi:hypothetical protein
LSDFHKLFQIPKLEDEQAKALVNLIATSSAISNSPEKGDSSGYTMLAGIILTVLTGACTVGLLWLFSSYSTLAETQKTVLERIEKLQPKP